MNYKAGRSTKMIPRFDEPRIADVRYTNRPGAYAVLLQGRKLLITHQSEPEPEFQLPGGGIDPGESPIPALHREVMEETGWTMSIIRRLGAFQRYTFMPDYDLWARKICHIYLCRPAAMRSDPTEPHHTAHWVSVEKASKILANAGDRYFLRPFL